MAGKDAPHPRRGMPSATTPDEDETDPRRWIFDDEPVVTSGIAVPPPAPVRPVETDRAAAASRGRRFAVEDLPGDWVSPRPRRSASSPTEWDEDHAAPSGADVDRAVRRDSAVGSSAAPAPAPVATGATGPNGRSWLLLLLALALVGALIAGFVLLTQQRPVEPAPVAAPSPTPTASTPATADLLSTPEDLVGLLPSAAWSATTDRSPDPAAASVPCAEPTAKLSLQPVTSMRRALSAKTSGTARVLQQVEVFKNADSAAKAFSERAAQISGCSGSNDYVRLGFSAVNLADQFAGVQAVERMSPPLYHTFAVARTGNTLVTTDAASADDFFPAQPVVDALKPALQRLCAPAKGACPAGVAVAASDLHPAAPVGFLARGDLPRVSANAGVWESAFIEPMSLKGAGCEGVNFTQIPGATKATQRGYVLTGDTKAPARFGLDEIVVQFPTEAEASTFVQWLRGNFASCQQRITTAQVKSAGELSGAAKGQIYVVDQRVTLDQSARLRVGVAARGKQAVYLVANPTPAFDLSDGTWVDVLDRAALRASQLG